MEHSTVEEHCLIERYHQGTLPREEEERFEAHFIDCATCQAELEAAHGFARGMKTVAAEEAMHTALILGVFKRLARQPVMALTLITLATVGFMAVGFNLGRVSREGQSPGGSIAGFSQPLEVPVVLLGVLRGEDDAPIEVKDVGSPWSLAIDIGADPRFTSYTVAIFDETVDETVDETGPTRFERSDLLPNALDVIQFTFPSGFLPPGEYRLLAYGMLSAGDRVEVGSYTFRLIVGK